MTEGEPKRILYFTSKSDLARGGQRSLLQLVERLDRDRFSPYVIVPEPGALSRELFRLKVPVFDLPLPSLSPRQPHLLLGSLQRLRSVVRDVRPHLIHADAPRLAHLAAAAKGDARLLMHLRVATPDGFSDALLARECDSLAAISRAVARRFQHFPHARKKISIIYNGIDTELFHPVTEKEKTTLRSEFDLPRKSVLVGLFAGFVPIKGHDFILSLWSEVVKETGNTTLIFAGDQPKVERDRLQRRIEREGLTPHVRIIPFFSEPERILPAFDIIVLPSSEEGFGRILIEAGACGLPVIGADIAGIDEAVEHGKNGLLAGVRNPKQWIDALVELIQNRARRKELGKQGREMVVRRFSLDRHVNEIVQTYENVLEEVS